MRHALHRHIPNWMISAVAATTCNKCHEPITKEDVLGLGIKEIKVNKVSLFVEYQCSNCEHSARMNFSSQTGSIEDLCFVLLDEIQKKRQLTKSQQIEKPQISKSKITDDETTKFIRSMNETDNFDDFLKLIGAMHLVENERKDDQPED